MSDGSGGFILALLTDSFAVRAFIGTLAASLLCVLTVRLAPIRSPRGRRLLLLAPVVTALAAAVASVNGQFLPTVLVTGGTSAASSGGVLEMLGETMSPRGDVGILLVLYIVVAVALLTRRAAGAITVRSMIARGRRVEAQERPVSMVGRLADGLGLAAPTVRFVADCPGGAFTCGRRRTTLAIDPKLAATLDDGELEGLLAHELAHLRRADPLIGLLVGVARDLTFFLPGVHLTARWLRQEQEESADELAARLTGRPAALASGILKVWQTTKNPVPTGACAAVDAAALRRALPLRLVPAGLSPWPAEDGTTIVRRRIERLISALPNLTGRRRRAETSVGVLVTVVAVVAALLAPSWLSKRHTDLFGFFYLTSQVATSAESPAFATFRALAPVDGRVTDAPLSTTTAAVDTLGSPNARREAAAVCPCVPTPGQLAMGQSASPTGGGGVAWGSSAWDLQYERNQASLRANRRVMLLDRREQQFGFLTAAGSGSAEPSAHLPRGVR